MPINAVIHLMPAPFSLAIRSDVLPVAPYPLACCVQADLASADGARKASLYPVFFGRLIPWLQFEISRIGGRTAEREWDAVVKLEVDEQRLVQFQLSNELDLDARRVARGRANGLRPAWAAWSRRSCLA